MISTPVPFLVVDAQGTLFAEPWNLSTDVGNLPGRGIMRSTDQGATWTHASQDLPHATTYALHPGPEGALYAAADHSIYRSTDHGAHWTATYTDEPTAEVPYPPHYKLSIHPEGDLFLLTGHPVTDGGIPVLYMQARLLHSSDQGRTWTTVATDLAGAGPLTTTAAGTVLVTTTKGVLRSADRGETWTMASAGLPDELVIAVESVDTGPAFTATYNRQSRNIHLFRSTDDGVSWAAIGSLESAPPPGLLTLMAPDAETLYAGSQVFRFSQPGSPWDASDSGLFLVRDLTLDAEGTLYAVSGGAVFRSVNAGATWEPLSDGLPEFPRIQTLAIDANGYLYAGAERGMFRSITPVSTAVTPDGDVPGGFVLEASYPNPFRRTTHIPFTLAQPSQVTLKVYDLLGREQTTLLEEALMQAGRHEVVWSAEGLPSGTYVYEVIAGNTVKSGSLILLK